jgi:hypothetical protein
VHEIIAVQQPIYLADIHDEVGDYDEPKEILPQRLLD